jgi:hypothetical protein
LEKDTLMSVEANYCAEAKVLFDAADRQATERIYKEFVDIIAGEERANVLTAIAFLVIAVTKGEDRQLREDMISAVADLARSALPGR